MTPSLFTPQVLQSLTLSSSSWMQVLQVFAAIALLTLIRQVRLIRSKANLKLPPGPKPWPIVGNLPQLGPVPHRTVAEFTKTYGPIVFLKLGSTPVVISSDPAIVNEIMKVQDHVFSSRPQTICGKCLTYDLHDFIMAPYGDHWRAMRRICVLELLSNKRLESFAPTRQEEARHLVRAVWKTSQEYMTEVDIRHKIESYAMNIMTDMILGKKYFGTHAADQDENNEVLRLLMDSFQYFGIMNIGDFIPWLAPLDLQGHQRKMKKLHVQLDQKLQAIIEEHREARKQCSNQSNTITADKKQRTHDFVDVLLDLCNGVEHIDDVTIKALVLNMMWSGLDVPVNISEWAMAELVRHPHIQQKLQEEIDTVVGRKCTVTDADMASLPYLRCVVKETFRMHPAGPFGVPRMSTKATKVAGYDIPAHTHVMVSNTELGMNSAIWPDDAEKFNPERWQGSSNQPVLLQDPQLRINPFGVGRRACPGASLGTNLVQLCVANLVHGFNWYPARGQRVEDIDMRVAMAGLMPMLTTLKPVATPRQPSPTEWGF